MKGQQFETSELARVNSVLVNTFTSVTTNLEDLVGAFREGGPAGRIFGQRFETTAAALGAFAEAGFRGTQGGTAFRQTLTRLAKVTPDAAAALGELKVSPDELFDAEGGLRDFIDIVEVFERKGLDGARAVRIFGEEAGPKFAAVVGIGSAKIREIHGGLGDLERPLRVAETRMAGATGSTRGFLSALEGLAIAVGDSGLIEWFTGIVRKGTAWVRNLSELNPGLLRTGTIVAGVAAAIGPLLIGAGLAVQGFGGLIIAAKKLKFVLAAVKFLGLTPVGLAISAVIVAGGLLIKHWDKVKAFAGRVWGGIVSAVRNPVKTIRRLIDGLKSLVPDWLRNLFAGDAPTGVKIERTGDGIAPPTRQRPGGRRPAAAGSTAFSVERSEQVVRVQFEDLPRGARVDRRGAPDVPVDVGLNLAGAR